MTDQWKGNENWKINMTSEKKGGGNKPMVMIYLVDKRTEEEKKNI